MKKKILDGGSPSAEETPGLEATAGIHFAVSWNTRQERG